MSELANVARFVGNMILAILLIALIVGILLWGYAAVVAQVWETSPLDEGIQEGGWLWIDGRPIYYREWGANAAPTVVLVHGRGIEGSATWQANASALADMGLHVIAIDLVGFGHSVRDETFSYALSDQAVVLAKALNELYVSQATVVGYEWGSAVALQLALEQPQFVGRLVLIAPTLEPSRPLGKKLLTLPYLGPATAWALWGGGPLWHVGHWRSFADPDLIPKTYWQDVSAATHVLGTMQTLCKMRLAEYESRFPMESLALMAKPTLILVGEKDSAKGRLESLTKQLPDAKLVTLPFAGRAVHIEQARQVNQRIAAFALYGER